MEMFWAGVIGGVLSYGWPVVLTLALLWGPDRRRLGLLVIGYFGILLAFCTRIAFSETPPVDAVGVTLSPFVQPLVLTAMQAAPLLFLLLFLNRRVRAIGPVLLVPMVIVGLGNVTATVGFSTYAGLSAKRLMPFLSYGVDQLPFLPFVNFEVVNVIAMLLFLALGWLAITWVRYLYHRKWFSEQGLVFDSIWLLQTLILCAFTVEKGRMGWLGLSVFAVYKLITWIGLRPLATAAAGRPPARLFGISEDATQVVSSSQPLSTNTWYHLEGTYDGVNDCIYVNGILQECIPKSGLTFSPITDLKISTNGSSTCECTIDDVRIYNYTRTPKQIVSDMNAGHPAVGSSIPVGYWKFDEGYGTTARNRCLIPDTCPYV
jgi:hypothetical protein